MSRVARAASLALLALISVCAAWLQIRSYDVWWHLEAGEQIVGRLQIPRVDDFTFTSTGRPWVDHEWLAQVGMYLLYSSLGASGLTLLKACCAFGVAAIGYLWRLRLGGGPGLALALAALSLVGMRGRLGERPESLTLLMSCAALALLLDLTARPASTMPRLAAIFGLTALWANTHAGALLAPALALACCAGAYAESLASTAEARVASRAGARAAGAAALMAGLGLLANPYGYEIYRVPFRIRSALAPANILNPEWAAPGWLDHSWFWATLLAAAVMAGHSCMRRRPHAFSRAAVLMLAGALAAGAARNVGLFFALLPLGVEAGLRPARSAARLSIAWGTAACVTAAIGMLLMPPAGARVGVGLQPGRFPVGAADFIEANASEARLYNDVAFGGYLIWRGYPARRAFIDGRNEVHADLLAELAASIDDGRRWSRLLESRDVEGAVVAYRPQIVSSRDTITGAVTASTFSELHFPRSGWALVYWDDVAMVFVRRAGRLAELAERREYRWVHPEAWRLGLSKTEESSPPEALALEVRRKRREDPDCQLAKAMEALYR